MSARANANDASQASAGATAEARAVVVGAWRKTVAALTDHPILVVAVVSSAVALGHAVWIWHNRHVGAFDPDEAGYIATSLRFNRALSPSTPLALPFEIARTGNGPLVPLLSVPFLIVGPDDPRTVLLLQPVLMVVTSVAAAGLTRRLATPAAAIAAGLICMTLPTVVSASQSYWLGTGVAVSLMVAMWALVASERLTNQHRWTFGLAVAAMLLSRSMALGFLPAIAGAGLVVAGRERRSLVGLVQAGATTLLVAGPWYLVQRESVFGYLFTYGYGQRSELFGDSSLGLRFETRTQRYLDDVGVAASWGLVVLVVVAAKWLVTRRGPHLPRRDSAAVAVALVLGFTALMSTANNGVWFELPMICLLVVAVTAVGAGTPWELRALASLPLAVAALLLLGCAWWLIPPTRDGVPLVPAQARVAHYEYGFAEYDPRFAPDRRDELDGAAADWAELSRSVERWLHRRGPEAVVTTSGNFQLFNTNTVGLAAELEGWTPRLWIPDTELPDEELDTFLTPDGRDLGGTAVTNSRGEVVERIVMLALHSHHLFTPDTAIGHFEARARDAGWQTAVSFAIPTGGRVELLTHPESSAAERVGPSSDGG